MIRDWTNKKISKLPPSIFKKEELEILILKNSSIRTIQDEIGLLKNLKIIDLTGTEITSLPESIGNLKNLEVLNLSRCSELEMLPKTINKLKNLKKLVLTYCSAKIPTTIGQLTQLEELNARSILGSIEPIPFPEWILDLKGLKRLDISGNTFQNLPEEITELSKLEDLNLSGSLAFIKQIPDLLKIKKLKKLNCSGKGFREYPKPEILQKFFTISSLENLHIGNYNKEETRLSKHEYLKIKESIEDDIAELKVFEKGIRINEHGYIFQEKRRNIKKEDFKGLDKLIRLKELNIQFNYLEEFPSEIFSLKKLERISIGANNFQKLSEFKKDKKRLLEMNKAMQIDFNLNI